MQLHGQHNYDLYCCCALVRSHHGARSNTTVDFSCTSTLAYTVDSLHCVPGQFIYLLLICLFVSILAHSSVRPHRHAQTGCAGLDDCQQFASFSIYSGSQLCKFILARPNRRCKHHTFACWPLFASISVHCTADSYRHAQTGSASFTRLPVCPLSVLWQLTAQ